MVGYSKLTVIWEFFVLVADTEILHVWFKFAQW